MTDDLMKVMEIVMAINKLSEADYKELRTWIVLRPELANWKDMIDS